MTVIRNAPFSVRLISELTQLDARESKAEIRRRLRPNVYRLGIYLGAAHDVLDAIDAGTEPADAFTQSFVPTGGMRTIAKHLGLALDVARGQWLRV